ncbi:hypothetical protein CHS0354_042884 [Potamilus streckersoni]|uniref:Uncharacterized protein n=1 Tax=Potamilus streckersoni TaxID=2493646 RepID=A0AAE0T632_9BIVA|nr:hypothetical protein CHS0354_042884 [Potamilus streckersoni]
MEGNYPTQDHVLHQRGANGGESVTLKNNVVKKAIDTMTDTIAMYHLAKISGGGQFATTQTFNLEWANNLHVHL